MMSVCGDNQSRFKVFGFLVAGVLLWTAITTGFSYWNKSSYSAFTTTAAANPDAAAALEHAKEVDAKLAQQSQMLQKILEAMNITSPPPPTTSSTPTSETTAEPTTSEAPSAPLRLSCDNNHFNERLLPTPREYSSSNSPAAVAGPKWFSFTWDTTAQPKTPEIMKRAFLRYKRLMFNGLTEYDYKPPTPDAMVGVLVSVKQVPPEQTDPNFLIPLPDFEADQSYSLTLQQGNHVASITSETVWGAMRGLETLRQIVECWGGLCCARSSFKVVDQPRYAWRGVMVDTARHFMSVQALKRVLDGLEAHKMNVFHWHIMDGQSFPLFVESFPQLSKLGAYSPRAVYMPKDVKQIVEYAAERGISVMPEFDMPSHVTSWGKAFPEIVYDCLDSHSERPCGPHQYSAGRDGINGFCVNKQAFNPTSDKLYQVLEGVLTEFSAKFPSSLMHLGGDELLYHCWEKPETKQWMSTHGISGGVDGLLAYFSQRVASFAKNKTVVRWEEAIALTNAWKLPDKDIFHVWYGDGNNIRKMLNSGHRIINSQVGSWYMDWVNLPQKWRESYQKTSVDGIMPSDMASKQHLLIGAESAVWAEMVDDDNLDGSLWPITSVLAEKMWSHNIPPLDPFRMELHICRLKSQGIRSRVIGPGHCDPIAPFK